MLAAPLNPNGRPNNDVLFPWANAKDIAQRPRGMWIIDFGTAMSEAEAALYEAPFGYVLEHVKPRRAESRTTRPEWWIHERPRPDMRAALAPLKRFIATPGVAKHRLFTWLEHPTLPDHAVLVFAREDDYFFGVLHSKPHELWALAMGTQLREFESGFRYTPTTTFETFPSPWAPGGEPAGDPRLEAIIQASRELCQRRDAWLNPPGASAEDLKQRSLTNLYNQRPTWLDMAHQKLDHAVLDAYGCKYTLSDEEILERLLTLNLQRDPA